MRHRTCYTKNGEFSNTSFPSKVLTYLGCGLKVVSPPIDAARLSSVSDFVFTYNKFDGESIAKTIIDVVDKSIDIVEEIKKLDIELRESIGNLIR